MPIYKTFQAANDAFYAAFTAADFASMEQLWASEGNVFCCHPGWPPILSRADILSSWREIFSHGAQVDIAFAAQQMSEISGLGIACGIEIAGHARFACTNLFVREGGSWRMIHHHAGPLAPGAFSQATGTVDPGRNVRH